MDPNIAIAIFTAIAAMAALVSAVGSLLASFQAKKSAEESKRIAEEQTKALMTAAKANALASRINFYTEQIKPFLGPIHFSPENEAKLDRLSAEREHLARFLDQQVDALGVGVGLK